MTKETYLKKTGSFKKNLLKRLKDQELAQYYLEAALDDYEQDGDKESLLVALCDVAQAQGRTENLPTDLENLVDFLSGLGFRIRHDMPAQAQAISVEPQKVHA